MKSVAFIFFPLILGMAACSGGQARKAGSASTGTSIQSIGFTTVRSYPHDVNSFTEGLLFHDGRLFESTGSPGEYPLTRSVFGEVDLKTGKINVRAELDRKNYFGEGIVFLKDRIYQLTYKSRTGFIYDSRSFERTGTFHYSNREGWGLTTDGESLIMSDGTNIITYLDPDSLKVTRTLNITFNGSSALYMNELEYINGFLYANVWTTNNIARIDPRTGRITGILDLTPLYRQAVKEFPQSEATNGIAFDPKTGRIFVTGKFWPYIFQIRFDY